MYKAHGLCTGGRSIASPLVSVPLETIEKAVKVELSEVEVQNNRNLRAHKHLYENLFEVKLKYSYEDVYKFRELDKVSARSFGRSGSPSLKESRSAVDIFEIHHLRSNKVAIRRAGSADRKR